MCVAQQRTRLRDHEYGMTYGQSILVGTSLHLGVKVKLILVSRFLRVGRVVNRDMSQSASSSTFAVRIHLTSAEAESRRQIMDKIKPAEDTGGIFPKGIGPLEHLMISTNGWFYLVRLVLRIPLGSDRSTLEHSGWEDDRREDNDEHVNLSRWMTLTQA